MIYILLIILFLVIYNIFVTRKEQDNIKLQNQGYINNGKPKKACIDDIEAYNEYAKSDYSIDDQTFKDLDMEDIFNDIDISNSYLGREYLYYLLRNPKYNIDELNYLDKHVDSLLQCGDKYLLLQGFFNNVSYKGSKSIFGLLQKLKDYNSNSNFIHYFVNIIYIVSILTMVFYNSTLGLFMLIAAIGFGVISYFSYKAKCSDYYKSITLVFKLIMLTKNILKCNIAAISDVNKKMQEDYDILKIYSRYSFWITSGNSMSGSIMDTLMDYIRMLTHCDLIVFNNIVEKFKYNYKSVVGLYECCGYIESIISIMSYRIRLPYYSKPLLIQGTDYVVKEIYHPLLLKPVTNNITMDKSVIITGSNASGKSTFLKTIGINSILSQTIYTSTARYFSGDFYKVMSSMSHKDDIKSGDSYYMTEIKVLKNILDITKKTSNKVLILLDELLKGTNTIERISASYGILGNLCNNCLVVVATHDIELTSLLNLQYNNYHFEEKLTKDDIQYSYAIKNGPANSQNAIKLLEITGFDKDIISIANNMADTYKHNL